ncbi:MAG: adenine specific DNA methyltransferase [Ktedonobacterales bacterium]|jgi:hypothetical protein|nr:MAG: adenine specific DNA methyltransferase [Ktedonobacterales bacterium]
MDTNAPLRDYLDHLRLIKGSGLAVDERSYYPALDRLFNGIGAELNPRVVAIDDIADTGAGHPDYALQVETTHDTRAVVEAKPTTTDLDALIKSEQVRRYLGFYGLCLVTNLRQFALVRQNPDGQPHEIMRYTIEDSDTLFWRTPIETLVQRHGARISDFLTSVLLWDAPLTRPKDLAEALARYAREALRRIEHRSDASLIALRAALSEALGLRFTDEQGEHFFRSSLVQTLFYGLFSAWVVWSRAHPSGDPDGFRWREAGDYLRLPVMRELFEHTAIAGQLEMLDIRKPLEWAEATLRRTRWQQFAAAFDQGDAVNYFYEPFLEAYDPDLREQLGVWYTPREIITYQVARVDRLLRDELGIADGLADERVVVLDPATGTGGYVLEVLRTIDATLRESGAGATRALRLRQAATQRVFGFEILPAPFVVAHLQIATLLAAHEAALEKSQRAGVYLTNALTGWKEQTHQQATLAGWPALKGELETATHVKHDATILVILGNPPYYGFAGVAEDEERDLIAPYYVGLTERFGIQARGLNDLYVRFLRLAERQIAESTGQGIVSFISNYNWLDGLSHPIMREHMLNAFDGIWIDSLNGDKFRTGKRTPWGTSDQSIFTTDTDGRGIQVGTAIATMVRRNQHRGPAAVRWRQFWGKADEKRAALLASLQHEDFNGAYEDMQAVESARFILMPGGSESAYLTWPALDEIFVQQFPGFKTSRDADLISMDREPLSQRMRTYYDPNVSDRELAEVAPVLMEDASRYEAKATRQELLKTSRYRDERIVRVAYRPFDDRWLYWEGTTKLLDEKRVEFFEQVFPGNLYLAASTKSRRGVNLPTVTDKFSSLHLQDPYSLYFPLYTQQNGQPPRHLFEAEMPTPQGPQPNIAPAVLDAMLAAYRFGAGERAALAESLFYHILAVSRAPQYEAENAGYLMQDWPRIPIPATRERLEASAALGRRVADLLRPDVPFTPAPELRAIGVPMRIDGGQLTDADLTVTVRYGGVGRYEPPIAEGPGARPARLWWNDTAFWQGIPPEVWAFTIGGYPVIKKWLDYRHRDKLKRPLRLDEVMYVAEMAQRIAALLALGPALDENYTAVKAATLGVTVAGGVGART